MKTWASVAEQDDDFDAMPGGIRLEAVESPAQQFAPGLIGAGVFYHYLETSRLKMIWPLSSVSESLGDSWDGLYDMLQELFMEDFGSRLIEVCWSSGEIDLTFEIPSPVAMDQLGIPDVYSNPRRFCIKFAEAFLGLVAKRKILSALEAKPPREA